MSTDFIMTLMIFGSFMGMATVGMYFDTELMYDRQNGTDMFDGEIFDDIGVSMSERIAKAGK